MPVEITTALIGIIGILLGAWGGAAISRDSTIRATESANQNAIEIMRRQEFNRAVAKLRAAFAPAQAKIYLTGSDEGRKHIICDFIKKDIPGHAAAIEEFRPFVPESDRDRYQKAWDDYCKSATQERWETYGEATNAEVIAVAQLFEKKIHDILAFVER